MRDRTQALASLLLALSAVAVAAAVLHREFVDMPPPPASVSITGPPSFMPEWKSWLPAGISMGDTAGKIKVIEFSDLECPVCRRFDQTVATMRSRFPNDVAVIFYHFPLPQHRFARPAARAAECAGQQGRFEEFVREVYRRQDSLGLKPWAAFARAAAVHDSSAFERCVGSNASVSRVDAGLALGQRMGVHGTPTVIVNGWRFPSTPDERTLERAIRALLVGATPVDSAKGRGLH